MASADDLAVRAAAAWDGSHGAPAKAVIAALGLQGHFEGGWFRETYRSEARVETSRGTRAAMTVIHYMLTASSPIDVFHTKASDGVQLFHAGAPLAYHVIHPDGCHERVVLGPDPCAGYRLQLAVAGGAWKAAELEQGAWGLVSEVVAPGWEMEDMVEASRADLVRRFPQHAALFERLARN